MSSRHILRRFPFLLFSLAFFLVFPAPAFAWDAVVIRVVDGDTLIVAPKNANNPDEAAISVRFYGIDAPEMNQPGGQEARVALAERARPGAIVEIIPVESDRYDRAVGLVFLDGALLNLEQVRKGHAWVYEKYCRASLCGKWKQVAKEARAKQRGLEHFNIENVQMRNGE